MQTSAPLHSSNASADLAWLWSRAAAMVAAVVLIFGSPTRLVRAGLTRSQCREFDHSIAPIEALVRSLLMSEAIAWLTTTEEGAETLRSARVTPPPAAAARTAHASTEDATHAPPQDAPSTEETITQDDLTEDQIEECEAGAADLTDEDIVRLLTAKLNFDPYEPMPRYSRVTGKTRAPAARTSAARRRKLASLRNARRLEVLRRILEDPQHAMKILARDLAARSFAGLYIPSPGNLIDERWTTGRDEVRSARILSFAAFCDFEKVRDALPQPEPG
jgi:hypothetical protein